MLAAMVLVLAALYAAEAIVVPFLMASFVTIVTVPLVAWLQRHKTPRVLAIIIAFVIDLAVLALLGMFIVISLNAFYERLPQYQERLVAALGDISHYAHRYGIDMSAEQLARSVNVSAILGFAGSTLRTIASTLANILLILLLVMFMLLETTGLRDKLEKVISPGQNIGAFAKTSVEVQKYLVVKTMASLITGLCIGGWLTLLDMDLPLLWGLLAFALNFIPTLGSIIAAVPAMLIALLMQGPGTCALVGLGYLAVNFAIGNFLEPRILGRALGMSPLAVVLSVLFWGWLLGPAGALISVPLTMVAKIFLSHSEDLRWIAAMLEPSRVLREKQPH